jgi:glycosyltransferase involved in cell wall biosynthesis
VINTAQYLIKLGITVDIKLCNETIDYTTYDLIHFFNIIRPADILIHIQKSRKPFVVSTIYVEYAEYEKKVRQGVTGLIFCLFSADFIEYLKVIARYLVNGEKILSPQYLWLGQKRSVRKIIRQASFLLPNSNSEYNRLSRHYKVGNTYKIIPNAIEPALFKQYDPASKSPDLIICAGRIEGRKNQLNLIRALNGTAYKLVIIGSPSANQINYYNACKQEAGPNISFLNSITQHELIDYYRRAKVHVLASWFETTGLSSLEAAAMGCNIVITDKGDTREYFENYAYYCDPSSPASILAAVEKAAAAQNNDLLQEKIYTYFTWEETARKTLEAYQEVLRPI